MKVRCGRSLVAFDLPFRILDNREMDLWEEIVNLRRQGRRGALATIINVR